MIQTFKYLRNCGLGKLSLHLLPPDEQADEGARTASESSEPSPGEFNTYLFGWKMQ
mgnify:CR=1 FL=1|jgi:hypothetical protein